MKNLNIFAKVTAYLALTSGMIWFGSYITRLGVTYQLFQPNDMQLKHFVEGKTLQGLMTIISPTILLSFFSYLILILSFSLFLITSKINIKSNGWLFITALIIFITMPFEIYLLIFDWQIIKLIQANIINYSEILNLIIDRLKTLEGFPLMMIICYLVIPYLLIFKPLIVSKSKIED